MSKPDMTSVVVLGRDVRGNAHVLEILNVPEGEAGDAGIEECYRRGWAHHYTMRAAPDRPSIEQVTYKP